ncbi:unnamed protein product [Effrenium voratum]|nr:unnamed protein product [Effrenium voratum]
MLASLPLALRSDGCKNAKLQALFEEWVNVGGDWSSSSLVLRFSTTQRETRRGGRRWLTRAQLCEKYGSAELAEEVIARKLGDDVLRKSQCKAHPEFPNNPSMQLYLVHDEEYETSEQDTQISALFEQRSSDGDRRRRKRKASSSSASPSPSSSSEASDSDDDATDTSNDKQDKECKKDKGKEKDKDKEKGKDKQKGKEKGKEKAKGRKKNAKKSRKPKKLTEEQKQAQEAKAEQKRLKDVLNKLMAQIQDVANSEIKLQKLQVALKKDFGVFKSKLINARETLQAALDNNKLDDIKPKMEAGEATCEDYKSNKPKVSS